MDPTINNLGWFDWQIVIWIPLAIMAAKEVKTNWRQIFDNELTVQDRNALQKINVFFCIPLVVLLHEIGHSLAILWANGSIGEFHWGVWWGYVVPVGKFNEAKTLIIYLAGSAVQVAVGFLALVAALFIKSPPVVALLVYVGLYSIGGTIIIYTLLSLVGMYGDWIAIYTSPLRNWVHVIGVTHVTMVAALLYMLYGVNPRLWYSSKTRPKWYKDYLRASDAVKKDPSAVNYLNLAWTFFFVDLGKPAQKALDACAEKDPDLIDRFMLEGWIREGKGDFDGAIQSFETIADSPKADAVLKCRALMAVGHSLGYKAARQVKEGQSLPTDEYRPILAAYQQASETEPSVADPRFYMATVLNKAGLHKEAEKELRDLQGKKWLDPALSELFSHELQVARKSDNGVQ
ncbi:MAG: hypothetical protein K2X93_26430 [Candidatus Obscuribacterales bacterium]|nr:hypothetical protein [Candidatus Obscuribacterales bacterium]